MMIQRRRKLERKVGAECLFFNSTWLDSLCTWVIHSGTI